MCVVHYMCLCCSIDLVSIYVRIKKSIYNKIYKTVDMYVNNHADRAVECVAIAVRELCDMRDSDDTQVFIVVANSNT